MRADAVLDYQNLGPDEVLAAVESRGYTCDGHLLVLNSFENRVYQVGIEAVSYTHLTLPTKA